MTCPKCGSENLDTDAFCGCCGAPLAATPARVTAATPDPTAVAPVSAAHAATKRKHHPVLLIFGIVGLVFLGIFLYLALSGDEPPVGGDPTPTDASDSGVPIVANGTVQALQRVAQLTGIDPNELVFYMEDRMIDNGDGTIAIYVNQESDPTVAVYLIYPKGTPEGEEYIRSYAVVAGTSDVYADPGDGSGTFEKKG